VARHFVTRQPLAQERPQLRGVGDRAVVRHDTGDNDLAEGFVRNADVLRHLDTRVLHEGFINLAWRDIGTAGLDDVGEPALPVSGSAIFKVTPGSPTPKLSACTSGGVLAG
jgi:hypothetical protein